MWCFGIICHLGSLPLRQVSGTDTAIMAVHQPPCNGNESSDLGLNLPLWQPQDLLDLDGHKVGGRLPGEWIRPPGGSPSPSSRPDVHCLVVQTTILKVVHTIAACQADSRFIHATVKLSTNVLPRLGCRRISSMMIPRRNVSYCSITSPLTRVRSGLILSSLRRMNLRNRPGDSIESTIVVSLIFGSSYSPDYRILDTDTSTASPTSRGTPNAGSRTQHTIFGTLPSVHTPPSSSCSIQHSDVGAPHPPGRLALVAHYPTPYGPPRSTPYLMTRSRSQTTRRCHGPSTLRCLVST